MALAISNVFQFPNSRLCAKKSCVLHTSLSSIRPSFVRFPTSRFSQRVVCAASSAAGSSSSDNEFNPYEVLGVNPIEGFDMVKAAYTRKRKDAERRGDEAKAALLEKAYDKLMMAQLTNRKKGVTFGSFKVSKDIKYADKQPIIPWGPSTFAARSMPIGGYVELLRFTKSDVKDMRINMAISAAFIAWILVARSAEWKPVQFLSFVFVYRVFEKLKANEAPAPTTFTEEGEDEGRMMRMGKRLLRSLALVFGCIAVASLGYTGVVNLIEFTRGYVPVALIKNQEIIVTAATSLSLYFMATYYR